MARPHRRIVVPAITWLYRCTFRKGNKSTPARPTKTAPNITRVVTRPNTLVTATTPEYPSRAAEYITNGISGSQGPKTKMMNYSTIYRILGLYQV